MVMRRFPLVACICAMTVMSSAGADQPPTPELLGNPIIRALTTSATAVRGLASRRVFIDPETGQIISGPPWTVPENVLQLSPQEQQSLSTSSAGLYEVILPDGSYAVDLQGRFRHTSVARINPTTGKLSTHCVGNQPVIDAVTGKVTIFPHEHKHKQDGQHAK